MFTGIIEEVGQVTRIERSAQGARLTIGARRVQKGTRVGDSIAVNGVCLTATAVTAQGFAADVMAETLRCSAFETLAAGSPVNLERAVAADGRFGGHLVSGHIDGVGTIMRCAREGDAVWLHISAPQALMRYIIHKGSIAIDGVSLTVAALADKEFAVSIIPHTGAQTALLKKQKGGHVNLECDVIGKYVARLLDTTCSKPQGLSLDFLIQNGF